MKRILGILLTALLLVSCGEKAEDRYMPRYGSHLFSLSDSLMAPAVDMLHSDTGQMSYLSITLAGAAMEPQQSMALLRSMVRNGRIVGAPGTEWPVCAINIAWIPAAWEVYCVTGDERWANEILEVGKNILRDFNHVNYSHATGLYRGGDCALPVASASYPAWMTPVDIFASSSSSVNALCYRSCRILEMLSQGREGYDGHYGRLAADIARAINLQLWMPDKGRYSQMLYGDFPVQAPVSDNLAQSLCILYDIATPEMQRRIMERTGVLPQGVPTLWPLVGESTVSPTVNALWCMAAARTASESMMDVALDQLLGVSVDDADVAAARIALLLRVFAGMSFTPSGIEFAPVVPSGYTAMKRIEGLAYRDATLNILIHGTGNRVARFAVDGRPAKACFIPCDIAGNHDIEITLAGNLMVGEQAMIDGASVPPIPEVVWESRFEASFPGGGDNDRLIPIVNGVMQASIDRNMYGLKDTHRFSCVTFAAVGEGGRESYMSHPYFYVPQGNMMKIAADSCGVGGTLLIPVKEIADRMVELSTTANTHLEFEADVTSEGRYLVDVCYANGLGPSESQSSCAIRTLLVNGTKAGTIIMPQLGEDAWTLTSFSNNVEVTLLKGRNTLSIDYVVPYNINLSDTPEPLLIDYLRLIKL